ncbi:hypothetical protein PR048_015688 [Dryococelus australis]|uniref:Uncharacterized protein n=1 Tax=Dryococelus australis TaxID=614101 RepID=A0ABQ9HHN6_9NEOP|nr:hypothetical protein PR048_015688 [Dryococelus australis]
MQKLKKTSLCQDHTRLKKPQRLCAYETEFCALAEPISYQNAMESENSAMWKLAINTELKSIEENNTWNE